MREIELTLEDFGNRIRYLRLKRHLTQDKLADLADISARNISDIENGKVDCHLTTIYILCKALEVSISELFDLELSK